MEGLRCGSVTRQGKRLPPLQPARGAPLRTGTLPAWKCLWPSGIVELFEEQQEHGGSTSRDHLGGFSNNVSQERSMVSTCPQEQSSAHQEMDADCQELPTAPMSRKGSTSEARECSELLSPAQLAEQRSVSDICEAWDASRKEQEAKQEEEEVPEAEAAAERDSDLESVSLSPLNENEVEAEASGQAADDWDEGHSRLF